MNDDRIMRRTPFDLKNASDGARFQCVCRQSINRFGWKSDNLTGAKQVRRLLHSGAKERLCVGGKNYCGQMTDHGGTS
jgi:hypothetical protein